ncbi:SCO3374 family protein [Streptomyces sp. NPDC058171]
MAPTVPRPRRPLPDGGGVRQWYENELGWPTVPGTPRGAGAGPGVLLVTGVRFDALEVPSRAARAVLERPGGGAAVGPVARCGPRTRFLVAAGSAEEVPGLLAWLEWGALAGELGLVAVGAGRTIEAPRPPGWPAPGGGPAGAPAWVRPPEPGRPVEPSLPALRPLAAHRVRGNARGGGGDAPDLVRLVDAVASECLRVRLGRARDQRWASSYA